jgi:thiol:disulfide interchange protein DsbC
VRRRPAQPKDRSMKRLLAAALLGALATTAAASSKDEGTVRAAIETLVPGATIDSIETSPLAGFYEVAVAGQLVYVSADGKYLIQGVLYDIPARVDLTETGRAKIRSERLKDLGPDKRITFAPKNPKHTVTVFTDIDCGYCRRMHEQIPEYNKLGISVEYLFFPRGGPGSESWDKSVSVWCSDDRHKALTDAKAGREVDKKQCTNPIEEEYQLGARVGVTGTPMIIAPNGTQLGGYVPPEQLLQQLDRLASEKSGP